VQDSATMRSSPSPIRSPTASAPEAASSSFDQFDAQASAHELARPVDEAVSADDQHDGLVSLSSDDEGKKPGL